MPASLTRCEYLAVPTDLLHHLLCELRQTGLALENERSGAPPASDGAACLLGAAGDVVSGGGAEVAVGTDLGVTLLEVLAVQWRHESRREVQVGEIWQ